MAVGFDPDEAMAHRRVHLDPVDEIDGVISPYIGPLPGRFLRVDPGVLAWPAAWGHENERRSRRAYAPWPRRSAVEVAVGFPPDIVGLRR